MMRLWAGLVLGVLLAAGPYSSAAQSSADAYFHEAAQEYVAGNQAAARRVVEQGLAVAPSDPRLQALLQKLQQSGRSQGRRDSSSTNESNRSQQNENSASDESSERGENPSEQSNAQQPGPRSDAQSGSGGSQSSSQTPSNGQQGADLQRRPGEGRPVDTLSRAQAERLLRALEGQERQLLRRIQVRSAPPRRVEKDW